jgi:proteasome lid subunit RPN8/RPN11
MLEIEGQGLELLAIIHSHPAGPDQPSATDRAEFAYPGVLSLILFPGSGPGGWRARAFAIEGVLSGQSPVREVHLEWTAAGSSHTGSLRNPPDE